MARLIDGEYWIIDSSGQTTYADGDIGDANHEMTAWESAFGVDEDTSLKWYDNYGVETGPNGIDFEEMGKVALLEEYGYGGDFGSIDEQDPSKELIAFIRENVDEKVPDDDTGEFETWLAKLGYEFLIDKGASKEFLDWYMKSKTGDARDYAIQHMGWVRVKSDTFQFWKLDQSTLEAIRNFDAWPEEAEFEQPDETVSLEEVSSGEYGEIALKDLFNTELQPYQIKRIFSGGDVRETADNPKLSGKFLKWFDEIWPQIERENSKLGGGYAVVHRNATHMQFVIDYDWWKGIILSVSETNDSNGHRVTGSIMTSTTTPPIIGNNFWALPAGKENLFTLLRSVMNGLESITAASISLPGGVHKYLFTEFIRDVEMFVTVMSYYANVEKTVFYSPELNGFTARVIFSPPLWFPANLRVVFTGNSADSFRVWFDDTEETKKVGFVYKAEQLGTVLQDFFNNRLEVDPWDTVHALKKAGEPQMAATLDGILTDLGVFDRGGIKT